MHMDYALQKAILSLLSIIHYPGSRVGDPRSTKGDQMALSVLVRSTAHHHPLSVPFSLALLTSLSPHLFPTGSDVDPRAQTVPEYPSNGARQYIVPPLRPAGVVYLLPDFLP